MILDRAQRDALRQFLVADLAGVGDVAIVLEDGNIAEALRMRSQFEEDMRLLDLLGWQATEDRDAYELALSEETTRTLGRLHGRAIGSIVRTVAEFDGKDLNEALRVADACAAALRGSSPASGGWHVERPRASEQNG
jgi:hypothetical protein